MKIEYIRGTLTATAESYDDLKTLLQLGEVSKKVEIIECEICGRKCNGEQGLKVHHGIMHREDKSN